MNLPIYQVDAFAERPFTGNPAAVVPLAAWLPDSVMQAIAAENNLSETAFVLEDETLGIRWFTPEKEVDLCGHATLAAAYVLYEFRGYRGASISFSSKSGPLAVGRIGGEMELDFPVIEPILSPPIPELELAIGCPVESVSRGIDLMAVVESEALVEGLSPDLELLKLLPSRGVIVTARGEEMDFVSRFFAPQVGIPEDPVTGSAHCMLTPYWAAHLGKSVLRARQLSTRGGTLLCTLRGDRVGIRGRVLPYLAGEITVPDHAM